MTVSQNNTAGEFQIDINSIQNRHNSSDKHNNNQQHWSEFLAKPDLNSDKSKITILQGGLTAAQDKLFEATLISLGYNCKKLDVPDNDSFHHGKEYGNRGQCNPTYFTVGNLIKHLCKLRDEEGLSSETIVKNYIFLTAGGCGPCRFGMYITEYRKALRDAGFNGFRVISFQNDGGLDQSENNSTIIFNLPFFMAVLRAVVVGDILNVIATRMRPYEIEPGSTDKAIEKSLSIVYDAIKSKKSIFMALIRCRKVLKKVALNYNQAKPKVIIMGEFWAITTEGDGNYHLQRFLEEEGAECNISIVTNRALHNLWENKFNLSSTMMLEDNQLPEGIKFDFETPKKLLILNIAEKGIKSFFAICASLTGLKDYKLSNMNKLGKISGQYYPHELQGGEGHLEVAYLIDAVEKNKSHMVISIKPFGCMPSSGVSDGVQSLVTAQYPQANFLAVETSGDGAVNAQSRIQMALFKARKKAQDEYEDSNNLSLPTAQHNFLQYPKKSKKYACTAANKTRQFAI
ncbi:Activator of (R)-2-hydroxyglutaryl-CoA dehydratase [hydrothermal vent metagenome]|uniref:Activator of (R)-2-hydroxyglutaryl-CoA dehydratase n=1 Tax=hydrothermal vent metagenome TaxID=652676 RepID=A0A3B0XF75_9ZZZZ